MQHKELTEIITKQLEDHKGIDIQTVNVSHVTDICDYMIIVTATSRRHLKSLSEKTEESIKAHTKHTPRIDGDYNDEWVVIDGLDIVVHIMLNNAREFYQLEKLWKFDEEISEH